MFYVGFQATTNRWLSVLMVILVLGAKLQVATPIRKPLNNELLPGSLHQNLRSLASITAPNFPLGRNPLAVNGKFECTMRAMTQGFQMDEELKADFTCKRHGKVVTSVCPKDCRNKMKGTGFTCDIHSYSGPKSKSGKAKGGSQDSYVYTFNEGSDEYMETNTTAVTVLDGHGEMGFEVASSGSKVADLAFGEFMMQRPNMQSVAVVQELASFIFSKVVNHFGKFFPEKIKNYDPLVEARPDYYSGATMTTVVAVKHRIRSNSKSKVTGTVVGYNLGDSAAFLFNGPPMNATQAEILSLETPQYVPLTHDHNFSHESERLKTQEKLRKNGYRPLGPYFMVEDRASLQIKDEVTVLIKRGATKTIEAYAKQSNGNFNDFLQHLQQFAVINGNSVYIFDHKRVTKGEEKVGDLSSWYFFNIPNNFHRRAKGIQPSASIGDCFVRPFVNTESQSTVVGIEEDAQMDSFVVLGTDGFWEHAVKYFKTRDLFMHWVWSTVAAFGSKRVSQAIHKLHKGARTADSRDDITIGILWLDKMSIQKSS